MAPVEKTPDIVPGMAEAIAARMRELELSPGALQASTGLSGPGLAPLRKGVRKAYQDALKFAVCRALRWTPDSIDRLLAGEQPSPITAAHAVVDLAAEVRELAAGVAALADRVDQLERRSRGAASAEQLTPLVPQPR